MELTNDKTFEPLDTLSKAALIIDALNLTDKWILKLEPGSGDDEDLMALPMEDLTIKGEMRTALIEELCKILLT